MQDRIQLAPYLFVSRFLAGLRQQISKAEKTAYQWASPGGQKAKTLAGPSAPDHCLGFVLQDHGFGGDTSHGSSRINR
jgi:hypothetical protein